MLAVDAIRRHDIRIIQATPTTWSSLVTTAADALAGRVVLCGGEPLTPALAADLLDTGCYLFNVYGPTETTIWSTVGEVTGSRVDVGVPLRNTSVFVAGPDGSAMPPGVAGELCIAGHGVARGYPRLPDLTAERFAAVPGLGRYYRTGDRARWHYDGRIDLLGRVDRQVKIRGHRIELGEVEAVLTEHQAVQAAAVTVRDDQLVAFVQTTAEPSAELVESLWAHVRAKLASYALPARLVLGPLPRNANGKIDHAALASMPLQERGVGQGPHEHTALVDDVVRLWREVLADPGIGPADNFFLSGGDSALAARMLVRLAKSTGVTLTLTSLLDAPTATALAQRLAMRR
jgi:acyl-coenzyme A synthetase/AMP-(fatty) acid ligase